MFLAAVVFFVFMRLAGSGKVDMVGFFGVCGFKQEHGLPCPGCGFSTSAITFAQGKVFDAFYIQPAAAVFCCLIAIGGVFSLLTALFGIKFPFSDKPPGLILKYAAVTIIIVLAGGWAVTLSRAIGK